MTTTQNAIKKIVLEFICDLKENIFIKDNEIGDLLLVEFFFGKLDDSTISNYIVEHVLPYKQIIKKRNEIFFIEKRKEIFAGLPLDRVQYFSDIVSKDFEKGGLNKEDKEAIWGYFDILIALAEKYKKIK